jgi:hypothetical protein
MYESETKPIFIDRISLLFVKVKRVRCLERKIKLEKDTEEQGRNMCVRNRLYTW